MELYRPVGLKELVKIIEKKFKGFPPRLPEQPIFYPVLNEKYATEIAGKWNANDAFSDYVGFVLAFEVEDEFISKYKKETVGSKTHEELWIPAEDLESMNNNIIGVIEIIGAEYGTNYKGLDTGNSIFESKSLNQQFEYLKQMVEEDATVLKDMLVNEMKLIISNLMLWKKKFDKDNGELFKYTIDLYKEQGIIISAQFSSKTALNKQKFILQFPKENTFPNIAIISLIFT